VSYGFCYILTLENEGRVLYYLGQKKLISRQKKKLTKKEIANLVDKRASKVKFVEKEMDWQNYQGSNKPLLLLIKEKGADKLKLKKEILSYAFSAKELKYLEAKEILCQDALLHDCYFNDAVSIRVIQKLKK